MRRDGYHPARWLPLALLPLFAVLFLWPLALYPTGVAFHPRSDYTDLLISHWPNAVYLRDSLARFGQWPLWNAQLFAGQPFAADPLAGMWYPLNLVLLVLPLAPAFNLLWVVHLTLAGIGMWTLVCAEGAGRLPALVAGAAFLGTPKLVAHIGAGHVSLVSAVAWTPWLLLAVRGAAVAGGWRRGAWAGAVMALTFVADVRWALYAGALAAMYWVAVALRQQGSPVHAGAVLADSHGAVPYWSRVLYAILAFVLVAALLAAPLALPLVQFISLSNRAALTLSEAGEFSLPPVYLIGLLIPDVGGFHEWMTYVGVVPLLLAVAGLGRRTRFWGAAVLTAAAVALGTHFVIYPLLFRLLPGLSLLRVPARAWFVVALGLCALAGHGAHRLAADWWPRLAPRYAARGLHLPAAQGVLLALLSLTVLDLLRVDSTLLAARPVPDTPPAAAWLQRQPGFFRVFSPSYSLPPGDGLQHLDGVNPLQLASSVSSIERAIGIEAPGYSVTLPSFSTSDLATEHASAVPDAERLGRFNVRFVAAEFPITAPGFDLAATFGQTRIYANHGSAERAWVEGGGSAAVAMWSPNRIEVVAEGPGTLVLSEVAYPGWRASLDGTPVRVTVADGLWRAVTLPAGSHRVIFGFYPIAVYGGLGLAGLGLLILALAAWRPDRRPK
jgi:hypothetical protein